MQPVQTEKEEVTGVITKIVFQNDTWSKVVLQTKDEKGIIRLLNVVGIQAPIVGAEYRLSGNMEKHEKYGLQFNAQKAMMKQDTSTLFVNFLSTFAKGIGGRTAIKQMTETYGEKLMDVIRDTPDELLKLKFITPKRLEKIKEFYEKNFHKIHIYRSLYEQMDGNISPNQVSKIYEKYGDRAVDVVKQNPYVLTEIEGFGFLTVDKIALASGISMRSVRRFTAGLVHVLNEKANTNGHVFLTFDEVETSVLELMIPIKKDYKKLLDDYIKLVRNGEDLTIYEQVNNEYVSMLHKYKDYYIVCMNVLADAVVQAIQEGSVILDDNRLYSSKLYEAENACAKRIAMIGKQKPIEKLIDRTRVDQALDDFEKENGYSLDPEQIDAIYHSYDSRISAITGGAGRGKTTIIRMLIAGWRGNVVLCAPTGRASQRMSEATGYEAKTIHRTVYSYEDGRQKAKEIDKNSLIIIDESSMINMMLAKDILWSVRDSHIVFVGDADQLPPIGPGNFFAMILKSRYVNVSRLEKAYRNMGSINTNADTINHGKLFKSLYFDERSVAVKIESSDFTADTVLKVWKKARMSYDIAEIRIITPTRKNGKSSSNAMNEVIREYENPAGPDNRIPNSKFRIGDRVMQTKNNYNISYVENDAIKDGGAVFNGETGTIIKYLQSEDMVYVQMDTGEILLYDASELSNLELSYAMTVHKAQGSEYKCVIFLCMTEHFTMLKRNLIYTAVTRAKEMLYLCGMEKAYNMAIRDTQYREIHCALTERIEEFAS